MNLSDLYHRLAVGELSNLALAENGTIAEDEREKIVVAANQGLKSLYTRFKLKESDLLLEQRGYLTRYHLQKKYAQSQAPDPGGSAPAHSYYINDLGQPFEDDVIKVLEVWDGHGCKLPLNEPHMWRSVFTPLPAVLQMPHPQEGAPFVVHYQAAHPELSVDNPEMELELPEFLVEALCAYIAHKVFSSMNTQESNAKGAEHQSTYEAICIEVVEQGLVSTDGSTSGFRFEMNGWI